MFCRLLIAALVLAGPARATEIHCDGQTENLNRYLAMFEVLFM